MKTTYIILLQLLFLLAIIQSVNSQIINHDECGTLDDISSPPKGNTILFDKPDAYIPYGTAGNYGLNSQPTKTINIAFHIFQDKNGNGNYYNNAADRQKLKDIVTYLNERYATGAPSDPVPGITQLANYDSKIRFSLGAAGSERIYFYKDDSCYNSGNEDTTSYNYVSNNYPGRLDEAYNVFFIQGYTAVRVQKITMTNSGTGYTSAPLVTLSPSIPKATKIQAYVSNGKVDSILVLAAVSYTHWLADTPIPVPVVTITGGGGTGATATCQVGIGANGYDGGSTWLLRMSKTRSPKDVSSLLAHEIGHSLGLGHVFEKWMCNNDPYFYDIYGFEGNCPHKKNWDAPGDAYQYPYQVNGDKFTNNVMTYGPDLKYFSPLQCGYMHRATAKGNIMKYVQEIKHDIPLIIEDSIQPPYNLRLYTDISIQNHGKLVISKQLTLPSNATITINSGGNLELVNGGSFVNYNGTPFKGSIVIKSGGKLLLSSNSNLVLGYGGVITVETGGVIECTGNSIISGSGRIILNGNINAEPGASITIEGVNKNINLIEVNRVCYFDSDFANVTVKNGRIQMNSQASALVFDKGIDNLTIDNILVDAYYGVNNGHQGIQTWCNGNIVISNCDFKNGHLGVFAPRISPSAGLLITNSTFSNCAYGFYAIYGGVDIKYCNFANNSVCGIYFQSMNKLCVVAYTTFTNNTSKGIYFNGSSTASLSMGYINIYSSQNGIYCDGPVSVIGGLWNINNNSNAGVFLYNNASLNIGGSNLSGNNIAIKGDGASGSNYYNNFNIQGGNRLISNSYCMYGQFYAYTGGNVYARHNCWRTDGASPVYSVNYMLYGSYNPLTLIDDAVYCSPNKSATINSFESENEMVSNYRDVETSMGKMPMDVAFKIIINTEEKSGKVYDALLRFELLGDILHNDLADLSNHEEAMVREINRSFMACIGEMSNNEIKETKALDKALKVISKNYTDIEKAEKKETRKEYKKRYTAAQFSNTIDEANILWLSEDFDGAIDLLRKNKKKWDKDDACYYDQLICIMEAERQIALSGNRGDIVELTKNCECKTGRKSGNVNDEYDSENLPSDNQITNDYSLTIMPNPVTQISDIKVCGYDGAELVIYNSTGQPVINEIIASNNYTKTVSRNELGEGVYMVVVIQNGNTVQSQKIVVVK